MSRSIISTMILLSFLGTTKTYSQVTIDTKNKNPYPAKYTSFVDEALTLKSIALVPVYDNVNGIYKNKIENALKQKIEEDIFWSIKKDFESDKILSGAIIQNFEDNPNYTLGLINQLHVDGLLTLFIIKGSKGTNLELNLYTRDQGYLLIKETVQDSPVFEIDKITQIVFSMYEKLKNRLPYSGFVTSRSGQDVVLNVGGRQKVQVGDKLNIAQILKINRHPKLHFVVSTEKEIIGKVLIKKVEPNASYGEIIFEKENGVISKGQKLLPLEPVKYLNENGQPVLAENDILPHEPKAEEWLPTPTPQYGKITLLGGLSDISESSVLASGQSLTANSAYGLSFDFNAELWLTPVYFTQLGFSQTSFSDSNDLSNSNPQKLNFNLNVLELNFGYKYLIDGHFWGPLVYASLGYYAHQVGVTDSTPTAFTSTTMSAWVLNLGGEFPVTVKGEMMLGAQAQFAFNEKLSESPVSSGDASVDMNHFKIYSTYQYSRNINLKGLIDFKNIQSSFSGSGNKTPRARSLDEKITSYLVGIEYLF